MEPILEEDNFDAEDVDEAFKVLKRCKEAIMNLPEDDARMGTQDFTNYLIVTRRNYLDICIGAANAAYFQ